MAKRVGLIAIILIFGFAFLVAVSVPAQGLKHGLKHLRAACVYRPAAQSLSSGWRRNDLMPR
jgi:hypothetical protein